MFAWFRFLFEQDVERHDAGLSEPHLHRARGESKRGGERALLNKNPALVFI